MLSVHGQLTVIHPEKVEVGDWVTFNGTIKLYGDGGVKIGNNVIIADEAIIVGRNHEYVAVDAIPYSTAYTGHGVIIGDGVAFGRRVFVAPGVRIGEHALLGAGAVILGDVPEGAIMVGNPARPAGRRDMEAYSFTKRFGRPLSQIRSGRLFDRTRALRTVQTVLTEELRRTGVISEHAPALERFGLWRVAVMYALTEAVPNTVFYLTRRGYMVAEPSLLGAVILRHGGESPTPSGLRENLGLNLSARQIDAARTSVHSRQWTSAELNRLLELPV